MPGAKRGPKPQPVLCGVYRIVNKYSGKFYIGSSFNIRRRWDSHRHDLNNGKARNIHLQRAWRKYGEQAFSFEIVELCPQIQLIPREQFWIDSLQACVFGYNLMPVADRPTGIKYSEERRAAHKARMNDPEIVAKLSAAHRGKKQSEETKAARSAAMRGSKLSDEHRRKMSEAAKKRGFSPNFVRGNRKGAQMPLSARLAISAALRARPPISEETRNKLRSARLRTVERKRAESQLQNEQPVLSAAA